MYEALYRKYRPKTFDDVVGQPFITETLKTQVRTGRLSHAYLFTGTRGTGKTTCARILAKAVNCEHPVDGNPCNECDACRGIEDGSVLDVVELDAASNNGVDDVRMLRDEAIFSPTTVRKRVYIIDEVHMLSKPAFNALLKILEEPPQHLMFILATTELHKVLPTILSRCQRHSFRRLDGDTIAKRLAYVAEQEGINLTADAAQLLGRLADGGMRDGLSLLDQCSAAETVDTAAVLNAMGLAGTLRTQSIADAVLAGNTEEALTQFESLWQDGKDPAALLGELSGLFRDALLLPSRPEGRADADLRSLRGKRSARYPRRRRKPSLASQYAAKAPGTAARNGQSAPADGALSRGALRRRRDLAAARGRSRAETRRAPAGTAGYPDASSGAAGTGNAGLRRRTIPYMRRRSWRVSLSRRKKQNRRLRRRKASR